MKNSWDLATQDEAFKKAFFEISLTANYFIATTRSSDEDRLRAIKLILGHMWLKAKEGEPK